MNMIYGSRTAGLVVRAYPVMRAACAGSRAAQGWNRAGSWLHRVIAGCLLWSLFLRESPWKRMWEESLLCRMLDELLSLVPAVLRVFYDLGRRFLDGSALVRGVFALGEQIPACVSWLLLAMLVAPYEYWNNLYSFGAVILFLLLCFAGDMRRARPRLRMETVGFWPVLYALIVVFSFVFSSSMTLSFRHLCFQLTGVGIVFLCVGTIERTGDLMRILRFCAVGVLICSAYALYQRAVGVEISAVLVDLNANQGMPGRVYSFFENPNSFAMVLVLLIPMMLALALSARGALDRIVFALALILSSIALVMTYARGGYLSLAFALVVFVLIVKPSLAPFLIPVALIAIPILPDTVYNRILSIFNFRDTSITSRIPVYKATLEMIGDYPVTGVGLGTQLVKQIVDKGGYYHSLTPYIHGHDIFLQIWAEMGLFGLLAFLGSMASAARRGIRAVSRRMGTPLLRSVAAGGVSGLAGILFFGLTDYPWSYPRVMTIFWLLFALTLSAVRLAGGEANPENGEEQPVPEV